MRRTKSGLPKHCSWNRDRESGKRRVRFRKGGFSTYLPGRPWSSGFMSAYGQALDGVKARPNIGEARTVAGSIDALIVSYYRLIFPTLKASTRAKRRAILERFRRDHGHRPVARLEHGHVASLVAAKADTPEAANNLLKVLRHLLDHAVTLKMIGVNPALGVRRFKSKGDGIHTWSEDEVAQFEARHPIGSRPHLALALLLNTGQRLSDVIRMGWGTKSIRGDKIVFRQEKTLTLLHIPITPELARALALLQRPDTLNETWKFLKTDRGLPFTAAWFGTWMRKRCDEAGLPQCSSHGLRKLAATRLANAGCSEREIMAITGHKSVAEVSRYTKERDQAKLAEQAVAKLGTRTNRDEKIVQHAAPLDKTGK
jgi:integrase